MSFLRIKSWGFFFYRNFVCNLKLRHSYRDQILDATIIFTLMSRQRHGRFRTGFRCFGSFELIAIGCFGLFCVIWRRNSRPREHVASHGIEKYFL